MNFLICLKITGKFVHYLFKYFQIMIAGNFVGGVKLSNWWSLLLLALIVRLIQNVINLMEWCCEWTLIISFFGKLVAVSFYTFYIKTTAGPEREKRQQLAICSVSIWESFYREKCLLSEQLFMISSIMNPKWTQARMKFNRVEAPFA